jgi:hypothetical protein
LAGQEQGVAHVVVALRQLSLIAQVPPDLQGFLVGRAGAQEVTAPLVEDAEVVEDAGQPVLVADLLVDEPSLPQIRLRLPEAAMAT